jgi:Spy/CpxP family protein refolding chaperone
MTEETRPDAPTREQRQQLRQMMDKGQLTKTDSMQEAMDEAREKNMMSGMLGTSPI